MANLHEHRKVLIIGNPKNRRVSMFQEALTSRGHSEALLFSWQELCVSTERLMNIPDSPLYVRVDSFGEDFDVEKAFLALGYNEAVLQGVDTLAPSQIETLPFDLGRIVCPRQAHLGFLRALEQLEQVFKVKKQWTVWPSLKTIRELFDKRITSEKYHRLGIHVPSVLTVRSIEQLRREMKERSIHEVFVKLSCSSSASCLGVYRYSSSEESFLTTIEVASTGWYNSLKLRCYRQRKKIEELISYLLREGSQVEESVPKAKINGVFFDVRVLMIACDESFVIVRESPHMITNLHLGGKRGDWSLIRSELRGDVLQQMRLACKAIAKSHDCLHVGIDVMFTEDFDGYRVLEANAFGDLFPNLQRDGLSVQETEVARLESLHLL